MTMNNEKRRIGRLPLYLAMVSAMSLSGVSSIAFASDADAIAETSCSRDTSDTECKDKSTTSLNGTRSDVGIMGGGFSGGSGVSLATSGETASAYYAQDVAIGNGANAISSTNNTSASLALGYNANASGSGTVAIGGGASATATNAVALGAGSIADTANTVSVGNTGLQRQITYMAAGTANTDGVNVSQLTPVVTALGGTFNADGSITGPTFTVQGGMYSTVTDSVSALDSAITGTQTSITNLTNNLNNGAVGMVQQSAPGANIAVAAGSGGTAVDFTGTAGTRTLTGVTAGDLTAASTDVVNGSQLYATDQNVSKNTGDIVTISNQLDELNSGTTGLVQQNATTGNIAVGAGTGGNVVDFTGTAGARTVTGVADGSVAANSNDAVNGSQLYDVNQQVSTLDGRVTNAEGDITNIKSTLADLGADMAAGINYDDSSTKSQVTLGGNSGTLITNVANGAIASGSMDAINGGQLSTIQDNLQGQIGGISDRLNDLATGTGNFDGDMGNERITNLAPGVADTDAVNVGQMNQAANNAVQTSNAYTDTKFNALNQSLDQFKGEVNDRFNRQDARIDRIGAMSAANTQMAINAGGIEDRGNGRVAVGIGMQSSKAALSVGYANKVSDRARMSFGAAFSGSEVSIGAGAGFDL